MRRGDLVTEPTGKRIEWRGVDVIPFENGLVKRKDVYSDPSRSCVRLACSTQVDAFQSETPAAENISKPRIATRDDRLGSPGHRWRATGVGSRF